MKLRWKVWLEKDGDKAFGLGPKELLNKVEESGSLHQAAILMDMSYSKAWSLIRMLEGNLGFKLLKKQVGGKGGGGSKLTVEAKELLIKYQKMEEEINKKLQEVSQKFLNSLFETSNNEK